MVVNQFTLEWTQMLSEGSQLEGNGDIKISELNLSNIGDVDPTGRLVMFPGAGQTLCSPVFSSVPERGPRRTHGAPVTNYG